MATTRKTHNKILEAIENGTLNHKIVAEACLAYMSEDDVKDMADANEFFEHEESEDYDEDRDEYGPGGIYEDPAVAYERERGETFQDRVDMWRREY